MTDPPNERPAQQIARYQNACARLTVCASLALILASALPAAGQESQADTTQYGDGIGLSLVLTDSGFALGGYAQSQIGRATAFTFEATLGSVRDEREVRFLRGQLGGTIIRGKANYVVAFPVQLGIERRLFRSHIEDNFRPFVHAAAGPSLAWQYPYFDDADGDGLYDNEERIYGAFDELFSGEARLGASAALAIGARFGQGRRVQGVRFGYVIEHYPAGLQLLEPARRGPTRWRGSPVFTLSFGRLF